MSTPPAAPSFRLDGKRAFVTGAGRGIGRAAAEALARAGADVVLTARSGPELDTVRTAIADTGGNAESIVLDVTDIGAMREAVVGIGAVDILINNAGTNRPAPFVDVTVQDFDDVMSVNLRAAFFVAQAVARAMKAAGSGGSIINMSSQMGHVGGRKRTVYCASKHAIEGLTKAMAMDLAEDGIRVNTLCPTFIETPMTRPFFEDPSFATDTLSRIPLGRVGQVTDLMGAIVFLASDASALMTGSSLVIDGGWTAQ